MTTYRKTSPAPVCLDVLTFDTYSDALEFNRANGLTSRPIRRIVDNRIQWTIVRPSPLIGRPTFVKLPHWERPIEYAIAESLPCFDTQQGSNGRSEPQPTCYASQWDAAPLPSRRPYVQRQQG